jgi:hypothetical protein
MPEPGALSGTGLENVASTAGFARSIARYRIRSSTSSLVKHGGSDVENLALACHRCNLHKGPNLSGIDPMTGELQVLFHPRRDRWADHFTFRGAYVKGLTACGRITAAVLALNDARRLELREELLRPDGSI